MANVREENIVSEDTIRYMLRELSNTSRVDPKYIQQKAITNEAMVELCLQLMETNQEQGNHIAKLIPHIEALTKLLSLNGTIAPLQKE